MPPRKLTLKAPPLEACINFNDQAPEKYQRKIAIVGCYPESWERAPFNDKSWEIWGFSRRNMAKLPRCDKWFELHSPQNFVRYEGEVPGYNAWLKRDNIFLQKDLPKDELVARFGDFFFDEGQCSWMLAYAITLNPTEIGIWGVEAIDRYGRQRASIRHFIQCAKDQGIRVTVPNGCTLMESSQLYGFPPSLAK